MIGTVKISTGVNRIQAIRERTIGHFGCLFEQLSFVTKSEANWIYISRVKGQGMFVSLPEYRGSMIPDKIGSL